MNSTKINKAVESILLLPLDKGRLLQDIINQIHQLKGRAFLVGGAVRDILLDKKCKDIDIEIHNLTLEQLENILQTYGSVRKVGKSFGVLRIDGSDIDWSLPRTDSSGRKPKVTVNPTMKIKDAFERRDVTMNALGINLYTKELVDPFNGLKDIEEKKLRTPNTKLFLQDPLRFFRVMQFIGRFEMTPDETLEQVCKTMDLSDISVERIDEEFKKLLLKSKQPSLGIRWLKKIGRLKEIIPELDATIGIPQRPDYHPEGDLFEHSMQALDAAAALEYESDEQKLFQLYAALFHDLGKVTTTEKIDGVWKSRGHAEAGVKPTKNALKQISKQVDFIKPITKLVNYHMHPSQFIDSNAKAPSYKRLAYKLAPEATIKMLAHLYLADLRGRNKKKGTPLTTEMPNVKTFIERAKKAGVFEKPEAPLLQGKDFLDVIEPGPQLGELVDKAYKIQINKGITNKKELKKRALS